jgi:uncharacterized membrane protein YsdA (DUF1294 family)
MPVSPTPGRWGSCRASAHAFFLLAIGAFVMEKSASDYGKRRPKHGPQPARGADLSREQMSTRRLPKDTRSSRGRLNASTLIALGLLLVIPGYALSRLASDIDWRFLCAVPLALSVFAFFAYRSDKRSAEAGDWRVPEATLHVIGLIGGWPGAFLAQRAFRHKTSKLSFQAVFWSVVAVHQFAAIDSLLGWRFTKDAIRTIRAQTT